MIHFEFQSNLTGTREEVWSYVTSKQGILAEMWPLLKMTTPKEMSTLANLKVGERLFRSYILLFTILPIDYFDLTLVEFNPDHGFVEESPMRSMKKWRHERQLVQLSNNSIGVALHSTNFSGNQAHSPSVIAGIPPQTNSATTLLTDKLTFQPRFLPGHTKRLVHFFFSHRHRVLRRHFR